LGGLSPKGPVAYNVLFVPALVFRSLCSMSSNRRVPIWPVAGLLVLLVVAFFAWPRSAASVDESKDKDESAVPDGTSAELVKYMRAQVDKLRDDPPEKKEDFTKALKTVAQAAEKILKQKATPAQRLEAVQAKFAILKALTQSGDKSAGKEIPTFLKRFTGDKDDDIAEFATGRMLVYRTELVGTLNNKQREQLLKDAIGFVQGGKIEDRFSVLMALGQMLEYQDQGEFAARVYLAGAARLAKSTDKEIAGQAKLLEGFARRSVLVGKTFQLKGVKVDGKPFKWSDYKGKVVLVDFWATWCRPCVESIPMLKRYYELYHDKGFEIVGVNVDDHDRLDELNAFLKRKELPWTNLFSRDKKASGGNHPMAVYYGVMKYPTTILVDQKGKVVELDVHGARLGRLLAKLLEGGGDKDDTSAAKPAATSKAPAKAAPEPPKAKSSRRSGPAGR
jgi:thiol-disulfide isomerase/thioredoxin